MELDIKDITYLNKLIIDIKGCHEPKYVDQGFCSENSLLNKRCCEGSCMKDVNKFEFCKCGPDKKGYLC